MKQNLQLYRPVVLVLIGALVLVTAISAVVSPSWAYLVIGVAVAAVLYTLFYVLRADRILANYLTSLGHAVGEMQHEGVQRLPVPVLVADDNQEIVWYNALCLERVFSGEEVYGQPVSAVVPDLAAQEPDAEGRLLISHQGRQYTAFQLPVEKDSTRLSVYYLIDDTDLKNYAAEYFLSRPSVLFFVVDTDDLGQSAKESDRSSLYLQVESLVESMITQLNGMFCRLDKDRYIGIVEERHMAGIVERRFEILDQVRALSGNERGTVSLSIGVGRDADTFLEGDQSARQALDMSLGRGGDQASVKTQNGYDFYGGISKGIEKRTKVKTRIVANALSELIETSSNVILMGHKFADLDSLGACVGLLSAARQMGKKAVVAIDLERNLVHSLIERLGQCGYADAFVNPSDALSLVEPGTLLIIVDTHIKHVLESPAIYDACKQVVVIDHHRRMVGYIDDAVIFYHEPYASSTCEMVTELVQYFGEPVHMGRAEAEALLAGIMLDTKNFVIKTGVRTFEAAAYLRRMGADTVEVRKFFSSSMEAFQRRARLVSSAEIYRGCAISLNTTLSGDIKVVASQAADELLGISNVDASFVLYEYDGGINISARSMGKLNVQVIMESLGGGGHLTMAAAQLADLSIEDARQRLLEAIDQYYQNEKTK
jgi:c-di-AMP phosphodiesterase-like protein